MTPYERNMDRGLSRTSEPRKRVALIVSVFLALALGTYPDLSAAPQAKRAASKRKPRPPRTIWAVRAGPGVIGVEWRKHGRRTPPDGYVLWRAEKPDGPYQVIARRPGERPYFLDAKIKPKTVYFYKVAAFNDPSSPSGRVGPACAWDNDQIIPNGSFELDAPGLIPTPKCPLWWARRAYRRGTPVIVRPGGPDGKQCVEIRATNASDGGGLHSALIPMIEGETWSQEAWERALPGARPRVGRCFYNENRKPIKTTRKHGRPNSYAGVVESGPDGWRKRAGQFTAHPTTRYVQIWLIGFRACNTFWLDGAKVFDLTARRMRRLKLDPFRKEAALLLKTSATARNKEAEIKRLEQEIADAERRMGAELDSLSPLGYRRLLVGLCRSRRKYVELVWKLKTLALLEN